MCSVSLIFFNKMKVKRMRFIQYGLLTLCAVGSYAHAQTFEVPVEFKAEAVQRVPGRPDYKATMYVSKHAVRTESTLNNTPVVEITNANAMTRLVIIPGEKIYLMQKVNPQEATLANKKTDNKKPCKDLPNTTCKLIGEEKINNRQTEKWEFTSNRNGQNFRSLHWIDKERRMPIREFFPDGTVTELMMNAKEKINGRQTEKWTMQITRADGQQMTSYQWYDPELKIAIREEMQGGFVRELKNIKLGKQDAKLFEVPGGYKRVEQLPAYLVPQAPTGQPATK
jgi:hypothetical protein